MAPGSGRNTRRQFALIEISSTLPGAILHQPKHPLRCSSRTRRVVHNHQYPRTGEAKYGQRFSCRDFIFVSSCKYPGRLVRHSEHERPLERLGCRPAGERLQRDLDCVAGSGRGRSCDLAGVSGTPRTVVQAEVLKKNAGERQSGQLPRVSRPRAYLLFECASADVLASLSSLTSLSISRHVRSST